MPIADAPYTRTVRMPAGKRRKADIVRAVTDDNVNTTILTRGMVNATSMSNVNAVGGDCPGKTELHAEVLEHAAVFAKYTPHTRPSKATSNRWRWLFR